MIYLCFCFLFLVFFSFFFFFFFFFSSRRRHTRYWRDWSSDVCSSDLARLGVPCPGPASLPRRHAPWAGWPRARRALSRGPGPRWRGRRRRRRPGPADRKSVV